MPPDFFELHASFIRLVGGALLIDLAIENLCFQLTHGSCNVGCCNIFLWLKTDQCSL